MPGPKEDSPESANLGGDSEEEETFEEVEEEADMPLAMKELHANLKVYYSQLQNEDIPQDAAAQRTRYTRLRLKINQLLVLSLGTWNKFKLPAQPSNAEAPLVGLRSLLKQWVEQFATVFQFHIEALATGRRPKKLSAIAKAKAKAKAKIKKAAARKK